MRAHAHRRSRCGWLWPRRRAAVVAPDDDADEAHDAIMRRSTPPGTTAHCAPAPEPSEVNWAALELTHRHQVRPHARRIHAAETRILPLARLFACFVLC